MALTFKKQGKEVYFLFEEDFYLLNQGLPNLDVHEFSGSFHESGFYLNDVTLATKLSLKLEPKDIIHMRLDPPFDSRYMRYLWMLDYLHHQGVRIVNNPRGIMINNEKLMAFKQREMSIPSFVGTSHEGFHSFMLRMKDSNYKEMILKPLDNFSGIGVEKMELNSKYVKDAFARKVEELSGPVIAQPFMKEVYDGELRALFYAGKELGTIIKKPQDGDYLANIAQGAMFEKYQLPATMRNICEEIAWDLKEFDVPFIAFDILGTNITEINLTCPGLIVEVSYALKENLAEVIGKSF
jgi:glutathione synthase